MKRNTALHSTEERRRARFSSFVFPCALVLCGAWPAHAQETAPLAPGSPLSFAPGGNAFLTARAGVDTSAFEKRVTAG